MKHTLLLTTFFLLTALLTQAQKRFDKQAHRGGMGLFPENTFAAMRYALDMGNTLEMDLSFSQDKQVVVSHDNFISSVFALHPDGKPITKEDEKQLQLYKMPYAQIKQFDVGLRPHPQFPQQKRLAAYIPLLSEMIDSVEAYGKLKKIKPRYNIEAKMALPAHLDREAFREEFIKAIMAIIHEKKIQKRIMLQSFDPGMLEIMHRDYPRVALSYLVARNDLDTNLKKLTFLPDIYSPLHTTVTQELVDQCHQKKMKVIPWTPDTKKEIEALRAMGVDGIITDYPHLF